MTAPTIMQLKMIAALIETVDHDDEDDAKQAIAMIKALLIKETAR